MGERKKYLIVLLILKDLQNHSPHQTGISTVVTFPKIVSLSIHMTRLIAIAISFLMLFQSLNIHVKDLLELDTLMEHYEFHAEEYGDNFVVFLSKHYGELKAEHSERHQQEQEQQGNEELPFQHNCHSLSLIVIFPNGAFDYSTRPETVRSATDNFYYTATYTSLWVDGPFQPPKQA